MTSTYDSLTNTIIVNSGINTLTDVYNDIGNTNYLSKSEDTYTVTTYTVTANIVVNSDATLIVDKNLNWNEPSNRYYQLTNYGTLNFTNNSVLKSSTAYAWKIICQSSAVFNITDADIANTSILLNYIAPSRWENATFHDIPYDNTNTLGTFQTYDNEQHNLIINNSEFYNLNLDETASTYWFFDMGDAYIYNSSFHDIKLGSNGLTLISWGKGSRVYDSEFYNITSTSGGSMFYCKEGSGGCEFKRNHIFNVNTNYGLGFYGSNWAVDSVYSDNLIESSTFRSYIIYWRANQYYSPSESPEPVRLRSQFYNNTIKNIAGNPAGMFYISGGQYVKIWNNTFTNIGTGYEFTAIYQAGQAGGSIYYPGNAFGSYIKDMSIGNVLIDNIRTLDGGRMLAFINMVYGSVTFTNSSDVFKDYKYLDVEVVDINNNPIQGATVSITNTVDSNYPSINISAQTKTSFTTGSNGHTPLPSDPANSAAILDFYKTSSTQQEMNYTITATYNNISNSTTITPDTTWYRVIPDTYQNTVNIQLPIDISVSNITGKITDSNNNPIQNVSVSNSDGSSTITDINGNYTISNLLPGNYILTVSKTDYVTQTYNYTITTIEIIVKDFILLEQLGTITGKITDSNNILLQDVLIMLRDSSTSSTNTPITITSSVISGGPVDIHEWKIDTIIQPTTIDTLIIYPYNLPIGTHDIQYKATNYCGNTTTVSQQIDNINGYNTLSDINGNYILQTIPPGNYTLTVLKTGYVSQSYNFTVLSTEIITKDFTLSILDCPVPICKFTMIQL